MISTSSSFLGSRVVAARPAARRAVCLFHSFVFGGGGRERMNWAWLVAIASFCFRRSTASVVDLNEKRKRRKEISHSPSFASFTHFPLSNSTTQTRVVAPRAEVQLPDLPFALVSLNFFISRARKTKKQILASRCKKKKEKNSILAPNASLPAFSAEFASHKRTFFRVLCSEVPHFPPNVT